MKCFEQLEEKVLNFQAFFYDHKIFCLFFLLNLNVFLGDSKKKKKDSCLLALS